MDDAKSAASLIADDLDTYQDDSLVETFLGGLQEFLDSPARVRRPFFGAPAALLCRCCLRAVVRCCSIATKLFHCPPRDTTSRNCRRLASEGPATQTMDNAD